MEYASTELAYIQFPLILLQAKAGGAGNVEEINVTSFVSINSPSGEGGGKNFYLFRHCGRDMLEFPLILLQAKAGGFYLFRHCGRDMLHRFH